MAGLLGMSEDEVFGLAGGLMSAGGGRGFAAGLAGMQEAKQNALKARLVESQIANFQSEAAMHSAKAVHDQNALQAQERAYGLLGSLGRAPGGMGATGQVNDSLPPGLQIGAQPQLAAAMNYQDLMRKGVPFKMLEEFAKAGDLGRPEVARTIKGLGQDGTELETQYDKFGRPVGAGLPQYRAPISVNQGDSHALLDPYTLKPKATLPMNQSPDSIASNNATITKPFEVSGPDGPALVRQDKAGNITPVEGYGPKQPTLKPIPAPVNTAIIGNTQSLSKLDRAIALLKGEAVGDAMGDKNATGYKGYLPNNMLNRMDPKGVATRAEISDIGSLIIHDRSGAAVTVSETPRLMPFIPASTDDAATAMKKLTRLRENLANESAAMREIYSKEQGYRPNPVLERQGEAPKASGGMPSVANAGDYAKIPKGATYTSPDGKVRVKQ